MQGSGADCSGWAGLEGGWDQEGSVGGDGEEGKAQSASGGRISHWTELGRRKKKELGRGLSSGLLAPAVDWMVVPFAETGNPGGRYVVGTEPPVQCWIH